VVNRYLEILEDINRARRTGFCEEDLEGEISKIREIDENIADRIEKLQRVREDEEEFAHELAQSCKMAHILKKNNFLGIYIRS